MNRTAVYGALLVALGVAAGVFLGWRGDRSRVEPVGAGRGGSVSTAGQSRRADETEGGSDPRTVRLERRLELLAAKLAAEADQRHRLEQHLDVLATELAALRGSH